MIIPDTQVKPGDDCEHLRWAGQYAAEKQPDVIIHLGDHWDMPSLSSYDKGKRSFEGRRYKDDIAAGIHGMNKFEEPINRMNGQLRRAGKAEYQPRKVFLLGNHEFRIERAVEDQAVLEDVIGYQDFGLVDRGWEVWPFLEVAVIDGVAYSHYLTSGVMGRPVSSAKLMLTKKMMSCVMGHVQHRDIAYAQRADGKRLTGIFGGTYYQHEEAYLNPQGNQHWHGIWMLHEVNDGQFDEMPVSMSYLRGKYDESN
jgi:hypothetical protein